MTNVTQERRPGPLGRSPALLLACCLALAADLTNSAQGSDQLPAGETSEFDLVDNNGMSVFEEFVPLPDSSPYLPLIVGGQEITQFTIMSKDGHEFGYVPFCPVFGPIGIRAPGQRAEVIHADGTGLIAIPLTANRLLVEVTAIEVQQVLANAMAEAIKKGGDVGQRATRLARHEGPVEFVLWANPGDLAARKKLASFVVPRSPDGAYPLAFELNKAAIDTLGQLRPQQLLVVATIGMPCTATYAENEIEIKQIAHSFESVASKIINSSNGKRTVLFLRGGEAEGAQQIHQIFGQSVTIDEWVRPGGRPASAELINQACAIALREFATSKTSIGSEDRVAVLIGNSLFHFGVDEISTISQHVQEQLKTYKAEARKRGDQRGEAFSLDTSFGMGALNVGFGIGSSSTSATLTEQQAEELLDSLEQIQQHVSGNIQSLSGVDLTLVSQGSQGIVNKFRKSGIVFDRVTLPLRCEYRVLQVSPIERLRVGVAAELAATRAKFANSICIIQESKGKLTAALATVQIQNAAWCDTVATIGSKVADFCWLDGRSQWQRHLAAISGVKEFLVVFDRWQSTVHGGYSQSFRARHSEIEVSLAALRQQLSEIEKLVSAAKVNLNDALKAIEAEIKALQNYTTEFEAVVRDYESLKKKLARATESQATLTDELRNRGAAVAALNHAWRAVDKALDSPDSLTEELKQIEGMVQENAYWDAITIVHTYAAFNDHAANACCGILLGPGETGNPFLHGKALCELLNKISQETWDRHKQSPDGPERVVVLDRWARYQGEVEKYATLVNSRKLAGDQFTKRVLDDLEDLAASVAAFEEKCNEYLTLLNSTPQ